MSLVGWWQLEGDATDALGEHSGSVSGASSTTGKLGDALSFDGSNDYVDIGTSSEFNFVGGYTISAWVLTNGTGWTRAIMRGAHDQYQIDLSDNTELRARHYDDSGGFSGITTAQVNTGQWYHVLLKWDGETVSFYLDGSLIGSRSVSTLSNQPSSNLRFGADTRDQNYWNGKIDDVRLYDHALSEKEVKQLSRAKVLHYKLDTDGSVTDASGQGSDGTLNGPTFTNDSNIGSGAYSFDGSNDYIDISNSKFPTGEEISISFWSYGGSELPVDTSIVEVETANNNRIANIHHPWGNGNIYWDCGGDSGSDRIYKSASSSDYKGRWAHWVFTKNTTTGEMKIYLDGQQWHSGTGKTIEMDPIDSGSIGGYADGGTNNWPGRISDIRVYATELSDAEIQELYETRASIDAGGTTHAHQTQEHRRYNNNLNKDGNGVTIQLEEKAATGGGWNKVYYGCSWVATTTPSRHIMDNWLEKNGTKIIPSENHCYIRLDSNPGDSDSNAGVSLVNTNAGDTITLMGNKDHGDTGTTETVEDNWMYVLPIENPSVLAYDATGGQDYDPGTITVNLDTTVKSDSPFTHSGDYLQADEGGLYRFYFSVNTHDTGQGNRQSVKAWLQKNGSTNVVPSEGYTYIRNTGNGDMNHITSSGLVSLNAGDDLRIRLQKEYKQSSGTSVTLADMNWLMLEQVNSGFQIYESAGGQSITGAAGVTFDTNDISNSAFSHSSGASTITVNNSGLYEISYSFGIDDDATNGRHRLFSWLELNGSKLAPSEQRAYTRGYAGGRLNSTSATIVSPLHDGDTLELIGQSDGGYADVRPNGAYLSINQVGGRNKLHDTGVHSSFNFSEIGPAPESLVGWWPLDGNTRDYSENNYDATNYGASVTSGLGQSAYDFEESNGDYCEIPSYTGLDGASGATIAAWVRMESLGENNVTTKYDVSPKKFILRQYSTGGDLQGYFYDDSGNNLNTSTGDILNTNTWYHVVSRLSGNEVALYVDGSLEASTTGTFNVIPSSSDRAKIGSWEDRRYFDGKIQDLRMYDRSLTEAEVEQLYLLTDPRTDQQMMQTQDGRALSKEVFNELT